ncbi:MAG TPA: phosphoglycerate mutase, partial [Pirellula sp.]|nr:phosphoglycerate mutase [Pirellula sp.]
MKWVIIIPDGCADYPVASLGGKTPLQKANIPAMDEIARIGLVGQTDNVPQHLPAGSEVANMSLLGYDPNLYFTGRAPIEAAAQGIKLGPYDWAIRCNLVTVQNQFMIDFTADHVSNAEATQLLTTAQERIGSDSLKFIPGVSYRNLLIYRGMPGAPSPFSIDSRTTAPHDLTDGTVIDDFPKGPGCDLLCSLMEQSVALFADHPVNLARVASGKRPATNLWLWGLGKTPQLETFDSRFGVRG